MRERERDPADPADPAVTISLIEVLRLILKVECVRNSGPCM